MRKIGMVLLGLSLCGVLVYAFRGRGENPVSEAEVVVVKRGDLIARMTETGFLAPMNAVEIKSELAGEVKTIFVQTGDIVRAGQPLAVIRPELAQAKRVAEARAILEQQQLELEEAQREQQRLEELFSRGFIAQKEVEKAFKNEKNSRIQYELAKKQLLLTLGGNQALYRKYLKENLSSETMDEFVVLSPVSGTVIDVNLSAGAMISSGLSTMTGGTTLLSISDLSKMWLKTKINEVNIDQIQKGQSAEIHLDALLNQIYHGTVVNISPKGETTDNVVTYEVTIEIGNPDARLKPSMTANVDIMTDLAKDTLYLPRSAVTSVNGENRVRIPPVSSSSRQGAVWKRVEVGLTTDTVVEITKGLREGEGVLLPEERG